MLRKEHLRKKVYEDLCKKAYEECWLILGKRRS